MTCCLCVLQDNTAIHVRIRCSRAGKTEVFQSAFRSCLCEVLFTGCRGFRKSFRLKTLALQNLDEVDPVSCYNVSYQ